MDPSSGKNIKSTLWEESGSVKDDSDSYEALFDPRPQYDAPPKPGRLSRLYKAVTDSFIVRKLESFFEWVGGGILAAKHHVEKLFSERSHPSEVIRNIRRREPETHVAIEKAADFPQAKSPQDVENNQVVAGDNTPDISTEKSGSEIAHSDSSALINAQSKTNERAFSWWLNEYDKNGDRAFCQSNFEPGARAIAQQIYDYEFERCKEFANRPNDFWRSAENAERLAAATALLGRAVPMPDGLTMPADVPTYSREQKASFMAFKEWKSGGKLPANRGIDLQSALGYAEDFLKVHSTLADASNKDTKALIDLAYDLKCNYDRYLLELTVKMGNLASEALLSSAGAMRTQELVPERGEPPPPPPPRARLVAAPPPPPPRKREVGPPPPPPPPPRRADAQVAPLKGDERTATTQLPEFPSDIQSMHLLFLRNSFSPAELRKIIGSTSHYFNALANSEAIDANHRAGAVTLANLWTLAKEDKAKLTTMTNLPDFEVLDQLLQVEKIRHDFK